MTQYYIFFEENILYTWLPIDNDNTKPFRDIGIKLIVYNITHSFLIQNSII